MLITTDANHKLYHVILVDVKQNGQTLRSFATSEQLIAWLILHPGDYSLVTNVKGAKLSTNSQTHNPDGAYYNVPPGNTTSNYPSNATTSDPLDILCDHDIHWYGAPPTGGTSGWG